jgi:hypothetical protein
MKSSCRRVAFYAMRMRASRRFFAKNQNTILGGETIHETRKIRSADFRRENHGNKRSIERT